MPKFKAEAAMEQCVGTLLKSYKSGLKTFLESIYNVKGGQRLSQTLANGAFLEAHKWDVESWNNMRNSIKQGMIGALYLGTGVSVLQVAASAGDTCGTGETQGLLVGANYMWFVQALGNGQKIAFKHQDAYQPLHDHGIDPAAMMLNSIDCHDNRGGNVPDFDPTNPNALVSGFPLRLFRLPIIIGSTSGDAQQVQTLKALWTLVHDKLFCCS